MNILLSIKKKMATRAAPATATSGASSDGLEEDSISGTPGVISMEEVAVVPPETEVPSKVGVANAMDPYVYEHFLQTANITWSTSQVEGTLLWYSPLHPSRMNQIAAYLSKIYNAWGGGMEYKMNIMGTGFHAGKVAMIRLPPNIHPTTIRGLSQWTMFEYCMFDPKMMDAITKKFIDQKNIAYHYGNKLNEEDTQTFGGWVAIVVFSPLRTSSTGNNQINLLLFNRFSPDFTVAQPVPINVETDTGNSLQTAQLMFPKGLPLTDPYLGLPIHKLIVTTSSAPVLKGKFNMCNFGGEFKYGFTDGTWSLGQQAIQVLKQNIPSKNVLQEYNSNRTYANFYTSLPEPGKRGECITRPVRVNLANNGYWQPKTTTVDLGLDYKTLEGSPSEYNYLNLLEPMEVLGTWKWVSTTTDCVSSVEIFNDPAGSVSPYLTESIILFQSEIASYSYLDSTTKSWRMTQPYETSQAISKALVGFMNKDQSIMCTMYDRETGLPVMNLRVNYDGLLTTNLSATEVIFEMDKYEIVPTQIMSVTDPLPKAQGYMANRLMCLSRDRDLRAQQ